MADGDTKMGPVPPPYRDNPVTPYSQTSYGYDQPGPGMPSAYSASPPPMVAGMQHTTIVNQQPAPSNNVVIVNQPMPVAAEREWTTGLCGCCEDCGGCLYGWFCGPCMLCDMSARMDEGCCMPFCVPEPLFALRIKLRVKNNIRGSIQKDCLVATCCGPCGLCQLKREYEFIQKNTAVGMVTTTVRI